MRDARACYNAIIVGIKRLGEIEDHVEHDVLNADKCIKEFAKVSTNMFRATGIRLEQESMMYIATCTSMSGDTGST